MAVLRAVFVLVIGAVGWGLASKERHEPGGFGGDPQLTMIGFVGAALLVIALDIFIPRKSLTAISGLFFGLVVGMVVA